MSHPVTPPVPVPPSGFVGVWVLILHLAFLRCLSAQINNNPTGGGGGASVGPQGAFQCAGSTGGAFAACSWLDNGSITKSTEALGITGSLPANQVSTNVSDFYQGSSRWISFGANTTTQGMFDMFTASSDFSQYNNILHCNYLTCAYNVNITVAGSFTASGPTQVNNTLGVTGAATFTSISSARIIPTGSAPTIASASTIAPASSLFSISGTAAISTITLQSGWTFGCYDILATGAWTTVTGGNIAAAMTAVSGVSYRACNFGDNLWHIK